MKCGEAWLSHVVSWRFLETNPQNSAVPFGESNVSEKLIGFKRQKQNAFAGLSGCSNSGLRPQIEIARRRYHEFGNLQSPQVSSSRIIVLSIVTTCHNYLFVIYLFNEVCFYSFINIHIYCVFTYIYKISIHYMIFFSPLPFHGCGCSGPYCRDLAFGSAILLWRPLSILQNGMSINPGSTKCYCLSTVLDDFGPRPF
jgi:hypothetical protein